MTMPAYEPTTVIDDPQEVQAALAQIGLSVDALTEAAKDGEVAAAEIRHVHPRTAKGLTRWIETVGQARDRLIVDGLWRLDDPENRPLVVHTHVDARSLAFASGTDSTGLRDSMPNVARKKGPATTKSHAQLCIPLDIPGEGSGAPESLEQWFFLYYRAEDEIRMEVSLPVSFDDGLVSGWRKRIILPPVDTGISEVLPEDVEDTDVDFFIEPREI